ncbi:MAG: hypothetical protein WKF30_11250 [Pyrinomonadaceae bacterium]
MTKEGLRQFQRSLVGLGYRPAFEGAKRKFRTVHENVPVEIVTTGEFKFFRRLKYALSVIRILPSRKARSFGQAH